ncbi:osmotic avoidance abnormal protein 3 isoform X2 [Episyrphus balteatus]|uniref:osmotic avoidance abnormal protein 3 isoform X2 n=1 Tax=Episyrphus balteatus TaxID=286459 RepID=UPI002485D464|nr:osmotic avoidance abnormal protein 3 isoform X2 [Episyrphus balteatus]
MGENVRVVVRCRPMNKREQNTNCKEIIKIDDCSVMIQNPSDYTAPAKTFTFDNAYSPNAPTEALYNDICYALVENVLEGYNGTIFAYGQTGCGKSHTMQGPDINTTVGLVSSSNHQQRGIITRSFDHIFEAISVASGVQFLALVSYLEIYNENIRDLLASNENIHVNHALKEIPGEGVSVPSLSTHTVHNAKECDELLQIGAKNRMVGATLMNAGSSRSHSIFTISLEQIKTTEITAAGQKNPGIRKGKLNLVDLAGSERQNKTQATGDRLKEATKINLSLSALGNVISALVDGKTKHVPYRDSKLTRLLQDSLGGNTKTLMIACISPADYNYDETLSTLRYASRAKNISNKPKINEDPKDALLRNYQEEIIKLKRMLETSQTGTGEKLLSSVLSSEDNTRWLETEKAKLQQEYESKTNRLREVHAVQQREKEELVRDMERLKTHYDNQLKELANNAETNNNRLGITNLNERPFNALNGAAGSEEMQLEVQNRIEMIKNALIGGERENDIQLKEKRHKKKLAAQSRLSALAHALSRVQQSDDRNLLQGHYSSIQQELKVKTESLKAYRQKIRALEREVSDLQSEFQLDRADYLETIRRLERNMKFYQQIIEMALPILRKDGKYWDPDEIMRISSWNDDLKNWKLPEESMNSFKLPLAVSAPSPQTQRYLTDNESEENDGSGEDQKPDSLTDNDDIASNYFRPRRNIELVHQRKGFNFTKRNRRSTPHQHQSPQIPHNLTISNKNLNKSNWMSLSTAASSSNNNRVLSSWLPQNHRSMSKTWCGLTGQSPLVNSMSPNRESDSDNFMERFPALLSQSTANLSQNSKSSIKLYPIPLDNGQE